jgi:hypothetical protein
LALTKKICAVGFEPNIHHTKKLQEMENAYQKKGWRVKISTDLAAATKDGTADFFLTMTQRQSATSGGPP